MEYKNRIHPAVKKLIVIVLIGIVLSAVIVVKDRTTDNEQVATPTVSENPVSESHRSSTNTTSFKDGIYSATGSYLTPGGRESIKLTVTIENGKIVDSMIGNTSASGEAAEYQSHFLSRYKTEVIGRNVDDVSLSRVAGSSLTSHGFNEALKEIKTDAAT